jgi:hypothetical protein
MTSALEYHVGVRHSVPASVALFSLLALPVILACSASAQINGAPSSVTSPGFGGRAVNGPPASVTSLGRNGYTPGPGPGFPGYISGHEHHRRHHYVEYAPPAVYALPVPYAVDIGDTDDYADSDADDRDPNYQGGPTIFDRRGSGADSYVPPVRDVPRPHAAQHVDDDQAAPQQPQEPTILVFKDGHKLEVGNYAIVGVTLFDLTPGHPRRIALSDLDLEATRKQNDERGVIFQLPADSQAN